jgi:hypothetical protein
MMDHDIGRNPEKIGVASFKLLEQVLFGGQLHRQFWRKHPRPAKKNSRKGNKDDPEVSRLNKAFSFWKKLTFGKPARLINVFFIWKLLTFGKPENHEDSISMPDMEHPSFFL